MLRGLSQPADSDQPLFPENLPSGLCELEFGNDRKTNSLEQGKTFLHYGMEAFDSNFNMIILVNCSLGLIQTMQNSITFGLLFLIMIRCWDNFGAKWVRGTRIWHAWT